MATKEKRSISKTGCNCLAAVQVEAKKQGFRFVTYLSFDFDAKTANANNAPFLLIEKHGGIKKRLSLATCAYCPFCGKRKANK